jgi:hypothetical protein
MRRIVAVAFVLALVSGCSSGPATYHPPAQPVRDGESALTNKDATVGEVAYSVLGITTQITTVVGSHGTWEPKGQYVRVRLMIVNNGRDRHQFDPGQQILVAGDGRTYTEDPDATQISRSPAGVEDIARQELIAFDLWFDIPKATKPKALRIVGDNTDSNLGAQLSGGKASKSNTADIPLS